MEKPLTFRSPTAVVVWVVVLLFVVGNWIDLAVQGRDHLSVVAAAVLLLGAGVAYVTAQRPRIIADDAGMTVRNPLRDHRIGWAGVAEIDLVDLLRVHCAWGGPPGAAPADREHHKVISAWAVHYSRRRQFAAEFKARRTARRSTMGFPGGFGGRGLPYGSPAPSRDARVPRGRRGEDRQTAASARHRRPRRSRLGRQHRRDRRSQGRGYGACRRGRRHGRGRRGLDRAAHQHLEPSAPSRPCSSPP